ncbi:TIGR03621 family F420-dependent LLM class oxidoreductase [Mycobacterium marseillense]|uniref:TIGR03621 family F420-dependent LLM class oxidoreductase n=1 Tax=Mycobacterium marseillense TaxID=701042 RepID=UPI0011A13A31|nr:TIGR03621 family F420-dependent LLM class oxidoreductase [Mycobacterium marseillense]
MVKEFRFGVLIGGVDPRKASSTARSRTEFQETVRRLEALGFDVLSMADHLGSVAPFPGLAAAAQATTTMRLGTCVLNAGFYRDALLARDAAEVNLLSDGRLELGLGAGYVREEFEAAKLPFPSGRARLKHLERLTAYLKEHLPDVPVMVAGNGDRLLTMAARRADIVSLTGEPRRAGLGDPLAERTAIIRDAAGPQFCELELNLLVAGVPVDGSGRPDLAFARRRSPDLSDEQLLALPGLLKGSPSDIAETLSVYRDRYAITYITVMEFHADHFAKVIAELR